MPYYVYLLANKPRGKIYIGVTNNLIRRVWEHQNGVADGFTKRHEIRQLVWYEVHDDVEQAIATEKRMKDWKRDWKIKRIMEKNPQWRDLWDEIVK